MTKILTLVLTFLLAGILDADALSQSQIPTKFPIPWGNAAGNNYIRIIPTASQIGVQNCAASLTDGFPPLTFVPQASGGCPPFGQDMNGILKQITQWSQWQNAGATVGYDSGFSSSIGGYPKGAVLQQAANANCWWTSSVDNNTSNPDASGANWLSYCAQPTINTFVGTASSTGSANAQVIAATNPPNFTLTTGNTVRFRAGFANSGPLQVNVAGTGLVNVYRFSQLGATMSVGGEVYAGQMVELEYDGTEFQCTSCGVVTVGEIKTYTSSNNAVPTGWLVVAGGCVSATTYADLNAVMGGSNWSGSCPGGQFSLPDGRGTIFVGTDNQGGTYNGNLSNCSNDTTPSATCGQQQVSHTITRGNLPSINFTVSTTDSGSVSIPAGQGSHNHNTTSGNLGLYVDEGGAGNCCTGGGAVNVVSPVTGTSTLPAMSGTFSGSGSGTAASGGSGNAITTQTIQPVQFATTMIKY